MTIGLVPCECADDASKRVAEKQGDQELYHLLGSSVFAEGLACDE